MPARAIDSAFFSGDADERKVLDWGNTACSIQKFKKAALPCYYAHLALERAPALQAQISFDMEDFKAQLEENCLDQDSESCSGLSNLHRQDTDASNKDAARFFAQRACDLGPCYMLEKIYVEDGAGADSADLTAFYLHRVIYGSTTMYDKDGLGKLVSDKAYFTEVVKYLQKSIGKAPDGRYKNSLYWALKQTFPQ